MNAKKQAYIDKRIAYWEEKRPTWNTLPVALIQKPLKTIRTLTSTWEKNESGKVEEKISMAYLMARDFALAGQGDVVKKIAREAMANVRV